MDKILHFTNTFIIIINNHIYAQHIHNELLMGPVGCHITAEHLMVWNRIPRPQSTAEQWPVLSTYTMSCSGNRTAVTSLSSVSWCLTGVHLALFSPYACHTIANKNCMSYDSSALLVSQTYLSHPQASHGLLEEFILFCSHPTHATR